MVRRATASQLLDKLKTPNQDLCKPWKKTTVILTLQEKYPHFNRYKNLKYQYFKLQYSNYVKINGLPDAATSAIGLLSTCDMKPTIEKNHKSSKHTSEGIYTAHDDRIPAEKKGFCLQMCYKHLCLIWKLYIILAFQEKMDYVSDIAKLQI